MNTHIVPRDSAEAPLVAYSRGGSSTRDIGQRSAVGRLVELTDHAAVIDTPDGRVECWLGGQFNLARLPDGTRLPEAA